MSLTQIILILLLIILFLLYFVALPIAKRRQMKQQQEKLNNMLTSLKSGDKILLADGIIGELVTTSEDEAQLKIASNTIITIKKMAIMAKL
ncbi:preprotein translocase subunit YajC [Loigolactobacillus coryniformis]|uniref:preprotein translocase subunit YajC n=1 Tax=Loigolactobacillus coryniformis TaxID=1610 RepID=UPI001C5EE7DA|nr:preprotein translocase subunit YajC [Loigolactobacillus coryniformis]MBW4803745.1 preprotein translocase subunit YajC [Loigolactobacillus coryniformis subsp. torquens]MBW4806448.1 preprotein translocase subunit YajC [Loigolactobacillus coryniformis subsp. torquens]